MDNEKINLMKNDLKKTKIFGLMIIAVMTITVFSACTVTGTLNDSINPPDPSGTKMTITTNKMGLVKIEIEGSGLATINWGDGSQNEEFTISTNTNRTHTFSNENQRTITIFGEGIIRLTIPDIQATNLNVSENVSLLELNCSSNKMKSLDVSKNTELIRLDCSDNQLSNLSVTQNLKLNILFCNDNNLSGLLSTTNNQLLSFMNCRNNNITSLNMTNNPTLAILSCEGNQMGEDALSTLLSTLHNNKINIPGVEKVVNIKDNPGAETCNNKDVARGNGWEVIDH